EVLKYADGTNTKQYNGNIAQQLWGHGATTSSTFSYSYDKLNRLLNGSSTGTTVMVKALTYDDRGNIRTLARNSGNTTATTTMTYTYENSNKSNRLKSLSGNSNN
ncbi:RHS repeat-associated core domain-containing protein, partial [Sphingobacterium hotanense]|nr:RHS repeat-associated core domain-containing protein [Sphingobacterium hotanense]